MKFLKSKLFIICLSVALVLAIVPSVLAAMGHTDPIRNAVVTITHPFRWLFNTIADGFRGFSEYFTRFDELKDENERLHAELEQLQGRLDDAEIAIEENTWLRDYFGITQSNVELSLLDADVVGYETGNAYNVFTLDRGTTHGVKLNMPVITAQGLVGKITEVGANWSKVTIITEDSVAAGAYVERTGEHGMVEGDYGLKSDGVCKMTGIPSDSSVKVGDKILTSGIGSVYPEGILIGEVSSITEDPAMHTLTLLIRPAVDMEDFDKVMIVTDSRTVQVKPPQVNDPDPTETEGESP